MRGLQAPGQKIYLQPVAGMGQRARELAQRGGGAFAAKPCHAAQPGQNFCLFGLAEQGGIQPVALQQRNAARAPRAGVHRHARRAEGVNIAADGALAHFKALCQLARCGAAMRLQVI